MANQTEQSELNAHSLKPDELVERAIEPFEGDAQEQLTCVNELADLARDGDPRGFEGLLMIGVLQPDVSVHQEVRNALRSIAETVRSPEVQGIAIHTSITIEKERRF